jgi:hypothetical protein
VGSADSSEGAGLCDQRDLCLRALRVAASYSVNIGVDATQGSVLA